MSKNSFVDTAAVPGSPNWDKLISRRTPLYERPVDVRSPFARDYTRILHSLAYRRLKHKTQVFFNIDNDHICTRMEHVAHVESVSSTIAKDLGLNDELTKAISIGHDLGHTPFGHQGETIIEALTKKYLDEDFWHEKNGLRFVDKVELLEDTYKKSQNLNLTYAVRDGIISHCGEVDENGIKPRSEFIHPEAFQKAGQFQPITWEGCVVKFADKIAYIGRDIEDAERLGLLDKAAEDILLDMARQTDQNALNTTVIIHNMIIDICENSSPESGIRLSPKFLKQLNDLKAFNYEQIYNHPRLKPFKSYAEMIISEIFGILLELYDGKYTIYTMDKIEKFYPLLHKSFKKWLSRYCTISIVPQEYEQLSLSCENEKIYGSLDTEQEYIQAILDYIAGMTDRFAIKIFTELITY